MSIDAFRGPAFSKSPLHREMLSKCPIEQFEAWFKEAEAKCTGYANPVSLGTVDSSGQPFVRTVLLKGYDKEGFRFFTNYESRKGSHLKDNPKASMCFYWEELERQIIVTGLVSLLSAKESDEYFKTRGRGSQIGAHVSSQSQEINSRKVLEEEALKLEKKYAEKDIPRPENWGGYLLQPNSIEFWQGQPDRLHDRFIYQRTETEWQITRLAP